MPGIGLLNEKPLHAAVKQWYARPGDRLEVPVDGFVVDIVRGDLLIEIQTGGFSGIRSKLAKLVRAHPVRLVYPLVRETWIVRPATGDRARIVRRKSPRQGRLEDLFLEMVHIPQLVSHRNFSLEVLIVSAEEVRRFEGKRAWRRRGWAIQERRLLEVLGQRGFEQSADWRGLLPAGLASFTTGELATALNTSRVLAQKMAYCLHKGQVIDLVGKRGRAKLYR
ncbi:MAG: hypothetical protein ACREAA_15205 [Candidatus Polarisedimenticolia bacterium]